MPKREDVILLFYIMSGVMVGIVCRKCMSVISGQLALDIYNLIIRNLCRTYFCMSDM